MKQFSRIAAILTLIAFIGACSQEAVPPSAPPLPSGKVATPEVTLDPESGWEIVSGIPSVVCTVKVKGRKVEYKIFKGNKNAFSVGKNSGKVKYKGKKFKASKESASLTIEATHKPKGEKRSSLATVPITITVQHQETGEEPEVSTQTSNEPPNFGETVTERRNALSVSWDHVPGAGNYQVRRRHKTDSGWSDWSISQEKIVKVVGRDERLSYHIGGLRAGLPYQVSVGTEIGGDEKWSDPGTESYIPTGLVEVDILIKNGEHKYAVRWTNLTSWKNWDGVIMVGWKKGIDGAPFVQVTHDTIKDTYTGKPKPWPAKDHFPAGWTTAVVNNDNNRYAFPDDSIGTGCHEVEVWAIGPIFGVRSEKIGNTVFGCP
ncbi:MAG: fibronectin type III domain-containing protein [Gemmatimonadetes bacterium]|nr:fibronectin type III domain-containing protein [Gemmatimonadota bacterium]